MPKKKYLINLTEEEHKTLVDMTRKGKVKARKFKSGIPLKKWRQRKDKVHLIRRKEHVPKAEAEL